MICNYFPSHIHKLNTNMNIERDFSLLKDSFIDFMNKMLPLFDEDLKSLIREKWLPFKEIMLDSNKSPLDLYIYSTRMPYLSKDYKPPLRIENSLRIKSESD